MLYYLNLCWFLLVSNLCLIKSSSLPEVALEQGIVRGLYTKTFSNRQVASFESIPYAKPPIGKYRFKEPFPASPWLGIYNATREPPSCLQLDLFLTKSLIGSEDCLYINVYTPQLPDGKTKEPKLLDVLAFIHGGAFFLGKSGYHGPSVLLEKDVVLVTFNYRLGPLGRQIIYGVRENECYLSASPSSPDHDQVHSGYEKIGIFVSFLSTEDDVVPGNNGLKDQVLALKWIQKNIAAFGGNPKSVTIGGLSAGGASCHYHLLSPLSKGLFHRAICMSGVALNPWSLAENLKEKTKLIATDLGCPDNDSLIMIECLRNRPAEHIVSLQKKFLFWGNMFPLVFFGPVIENPSATAFISDLPVNIMKDNGGSDVPAIIAFTVDEGLCGAGEILTTPGMFTDLQKRWNELIPHVLDYNYTVPPDKRLEITQKIKEKYEIKDTPEGHKVLIKMIGDRMFASGISKISKLSASVKTTPVYVYRFSYRGKHSMTELLYTKEDLGVSHGDDVFYTLGFSNFNFIETESDSTMSKQMLNVFVSFLRNGSLGENWEPVNRHLPKIVFTDIKGPNDFQLTTVDELGDESFWDSLGFIENMK